MTSLSMMVNEDTIKKMNKFYQDNLVDNKNPHALFIAKTDECTITAYKTGKVLFQGKKADEEAAVWSNTKPHKKEIKEDYYLESIGSDEVGTGDYFGPVVIVSTYLDDKNISEIKKFHIDDSKKLTDDYIINIAPKLFKILPYSLLIVHNEKYNELMSQKEMNLNKMKAVLHKQAITNLLDKIHKHPHIIIDQFCSIDNFNNYINDSAFTKLVDFHTKAESKFASVACASIMARYIFLKEMAKLSKELNVTLVKGASDLVDKQGKILVKQFGPEILKKIAKLHFKNTDKILN